MKYKNSKKTVKKEIPDWLSSDPFCLDNYCFSLRKFSKKLEQIAPVSKDPMSWSWKNFSKYVMELATQIFLELNKFYDNVSYHIKRDISAAVVLEFPHLEELYESFRQKHAKGQLDKEIAKTTLKPTLFTEFFCQRLDQRFRYNEKKLAKENGFKIVPRKGSGVLVAEANKRRKGEKRKIACENYI